MTASKSKLIDPKAYWLGGNECSVYNPICKKVDTSSKGGEYE